LGLGHVTRILR